MTKNQSSNSGDSGSFVTGLSVGLIGGALGYFLFATDKGSSVRKQLAKEWKSVHGKLHELEPAKATKSDSLKEIFKSLMTDILEKAQQEQKAVEEELAKMPKSKKKKKLFKGV